MPFHGKTHTQWLTPIEIASMVNYLHMPTMDPIFDAASQQTPTLSKKFKVR